MVNSLDQLIPRRFRSIGTGPEEQFIETRHAHVCDTAADLTVRRVCLGVQVLGEIMVDNSVEQTVIGGAEPRRLTPIVYPSRHTGLLAGCETHGSAHMIAWRNPSCPTPASVTP